MPVFEYCATCGTRWDSPDDEYPINICKDCGKDRCAECSFFDHKDCNDED